VSRFRQNATTARARRQSRGLWRGLRFDLSLGDGGTSIRRTLASNDVFDVSRPADGAIPPAGVEPATSQVRSRALCPLSYGADAYRPSRAIRDNFAVASILGHAEDGRHHQARHHGSRVARRACETQAPAPARPAGSEVRRSASASLAGGHAALPAPCMPNRLYGGGGQLRSQPICAL
jgi:hypothetical protein